MWKLRTPTPWIVQFRCTAVDILMDLIPAFFFYIKFTLFLTILGLHCCTVFCSCSELGLLFSRGSLCSTGFPLRWFLLLWNTGSRHMGFSSCSSWAQQLWCLGLAAPWQVKSSQTRNQTCVPCIGRWILNHWTTVEVPFLSHLKEAPHLAWAPVQGCKTLCWTRILTTTTLTGLRWSYNQKLPQSLFFFF